MSGTGHTTQYNNTSRHSQLTTDRINLSTWTFPPYLLYSITWACPMSEPSINHQILKSELNRMLKCQKLLKKLLCKVEVCIEIRKMGKPPFLPLNSWDKGYNVEERAVLVSVSSNSGLTMVTWKLVREMREELSNNEGYAVMIGTPF